MSARDWSRNEVEATVASYLSMLSMELKGEYYNKSEYRRQLCNLLNNRSESAIEKKHQNISAVLIRLGLPYVRGYKPLYNYQNILPDIVTVAINSNNGIITAIEKESDPFIQLPTVDDILTILEAPPEPTFLKEEPAYYETHRKPIKVNYLERESRNQKLGNAGEIFVLQFEKARLIHYGKDNLADRVEHTASIDDHAGFDIRSFDEYGKDRFIEVKTTTCGKEFPFYLSSNEVNASLKHSDNYFLYRLFNFRKRKPGMYQLQGALNDTCNMLPTEYIASVSKKYKSCSVMF